MSSTKKKIIAFMICAVLFFSVGAGAVISYALNQLRYSSGVTIQFRGKRDVYAVINGSSAIDGVTNQTLTQVTLNGESTTPATQNFENSITISSGETLTFEFSILNNNSYTDASNLYVLPEITATGATPTISTQFKIGASGTYGAYASAINHCGYITVAKNETLFVKHTITLSENAEDVNFSLAITFDLNSDRSLPSNYQNWNNRATEGYNLTFSANGCGAELSITVTRAGNVHETWQYLFSGSGGSNNSYNSSALSIQNMNAVSGLNIQNVYNPDGFYWTNGTDIQSGDTLSLSDVVSIDAITNDSALYSCYYFGTYTAVETGALTSDVAIEMKAGGGSN